MKRTTTLFVFLLTTFIAAQAVLIRNATLANYDFTLTTAFTTANSNYSGNNTSGTTTVPLSGTTGGYMYSGVTAGTGPRGTKITNMTTTDARVDTICYEFDWNPFRLGGQENSTGTSGIYPNQYGMCIVRDSKDSIVFGVWYDRWSLKAGSKYNTSTGSQPLGDLHLMNLSTDINNPVPARIITQTIPNTTTTWSYYSNILIPFAMLDQNYSSNYYAVKCDSINQSTDLGAAFKMNQWYHIKANIDFKNKKIISFTINLIGSTEVTRTYNNLPFIHTGAQDVSRLEIACPRGYNEGTATGAACNFEQRFDNIDIYSIKQGSVVSSTSYIKDLNYEYGQGPSAEQSFTLSDATGDFTLSPSANIEISSTSGTGLTNSALNATLSTSSPTKTFYIRLKSGLARAEYTDSIIITSPGLSTQKITCKGTVLGPTISTTVNGLACSYVKYKGPSAEKSFNLTGSLLESDITITPSAHFEISKSSGAGYTSQSLTFTPDSKTLSSTLVYVRLKAGLNTGVYNDSLTLTATNATTKKIYCTGTVSSSITLSSTSMSAFNYIINEGPSNTQTVTVTGKGIDSIVIQPSANYEVEYNSNTTSNKIVLYGTEGDLSALLYIRLKAGLSVGTYNENIAFTYNGTNTQNLSCSGTVNPKRLFVSTNSFNEFKYIYANGPSDQQAITVRGRNLLGNITVTPSANYQLSKVSGGTFSSTPIVLSMVGDSVGATIIYIRLKASLPIASYLGKLTVSTTGEDSISIDCVGAVYDPSVLTSTPNNKENGVRMSRTQDGNVVSGLKTGEIVTLYSVTGIKLKELNAESETLILPALNTGVYFIKTHDACFKVIF